MEFGSTIRGAFALEPGSAFLNHGSFGATPRRVLAAQDAWRARMERNPVAFLYRELPAIQRAAATELAGFVGAAPDDLAFVENATTAVNAVVRSLELEPGDEIVALTHVYGAVHNTLRFVCARSGARLVLAEVPFPVESPDAFVEAVRDALTERTRLAVLDHITSATGLLLPIEAMTAVCRDAGVPVLVDGAHAPGHVPLDLPALGATWYTGNAHKWLFAPKGCALLWAADHDVHPTVISHNYQQGFAPEFDWIGTRDPTAWLAVTEALAFVDELGFDRIRAHNQQLCADGLALLCEAWGTEPTAPASMRANLATLAPPFAGEPTPDAGKAISAWLWQHHRIEIPIFPFGGRLWLRISAQVYNDLEHYERLATAAREVP